MNASMPAMSAPSIVQQRVALVVLLAIIGAAVWLQPADGNSNHPVQKFSKTPVPDVIAQLDFANAEAAWYGLKIDLNGSLQIDALTETALTDTIALMQDQPSEPALELAMARIAVLLEKQFGATASQQIMELLPKLKNYKEIEQRWLKENIGRDPVPYAELFQLQDALLGKTLAKKLFSTQRRLAEMMLASQQIRNDASLTQAQKDQALNELQKNLQEKSESGE